MTDIRKLFVTELVGNINVRRDISLYGKMPGDTVPRREPHPAVNDIYMMGVNDAITVLLSITDDRELNLAPWRVTDKEGNVVSFCNPEDGDEYLATPGLIHMFQQELAK